MGHFDTRFEDLPVVLPIFPLTGALLLPHGRLPLNIFEPRYLNMTVDALGHGRMIGMVQPTDPEGGGAHPEVYPTGCAGRISSFAETDDNRLLITLTGVVRFRIASEIEGVRGYRRVAADYAPFREDLDEEQPEDGIDRDRLLAGLRGYLRLHSLNVNWEVIEGAPTLALVTSVAMLCPFAPTEKQALLEAPNLPRRAEIMCTLMEMALFDKGANGTSRQ